MQKSLSSWKGKFLLKGGKLEMLKSVISSMPLYFLSLFIAPSLIIQRLEKIHRDFLWNSFDGSSKFHLMVWNNICRSIDKGGLGIQPLPLMNSVGGKIVVEVWGGK